MITRAPKRKRETGDRRAKRAQAATGMAHAAKSPPKAIPSANDGETPVSGACRAR
jgi:hypothetical protein